MKLTTHKSTLLPCISALAIAILCLTIAIPIDAEDSPSPENPNHVSMTWEEFRRLLRIDSDEIQLSWEEFYKLLSLTGSEVKIDYNIQGGKVILQRDQFKQLLDKMKPPRITTLNPPGDYLVTKATYIGVMSKKSTTFHAQFFIEIFEKERDAYPKIMLLPKEVAIREVKIDNKPALVMIENGWYVLTTDKTGQHIVDVEFSLKINPDQGPAVFDLAVPATAITLFKLDVPMINVQVEIPQEKYMTTSQINGHTKIDAVLASTDRINVRMHQLLPEDIAKKKEPAKIYVETWTMLTIEDDVLHVTTKFDLDILQNTASEIEIIVPDGYSILYVRDQNSQELRDWSTRTEKGQEILTIPFGGQKIGRVTITVTAEKIARSEDDTLGFAGFQVLKAVRETGYVGIQKKNTAEVDIVSVENIDEIDIQRLPMDLLGMSERPIIFALRYLHHPFSLALAITKHAELSVIGTVIDDASIVSVFLEDGKIITRVVYTMRSTGRQFLQLTLPAGAEIWSLYVDGKRELPSIDNQGNFKIPLVSSRIENGMIIPFEVEIVYYTKSKGFTVFGAEKLQIPKADVIISRLLLSCYLPVEYRYVGFGGNLEKEKIASGLNLLFGTGRIFTYDEVDKYSQVLESVEKGTPQAMDKDALRVQSKLRSEFKTSSYNESEAFTNQLREEIGFAENVQREHGAIGAPVLRIDIPTSGRLYRFAKTLVQGENLYVTIQYTKGWVSTIINILIIALLAALVYLLRSYLKKGYYVIRALVQSQKAFWEKCKTPRGIKIIIGISAFVSLFISKALFVILVLLFVLALVKPQWIFRKQEKSV